MWNSVAQQEVGALVLSADSAVSLLPKRCRILRDDAVCYSRSVFTALDSRQQLATITGPSAIGIREAERIACLWPPARTLRWLKLRNECRQLVSVFRGNAIAHQQSKLVR